MSPNEHRSWNPLQPFPKHPHTRAENCLPALAPCTPMAATSTAANNTANDVAAAEISLKPAHEVMLCGKRESLFVISKHAGDKKMICGNRSDISERDMPEIEPHLPPSRYRA